MHTIFIKFMEEEVKGHPKQIFIKFMEEEVKGHPECLGHCYKIVGQTSKYKLLEQILAACPDLCAQA